MSSKTGDFGETFLVFLDKLIHTFLVEGVSIETQQWMKIIILVIAFLFVVVMTRVISAIFTQLLKPALVAMNSRPEYVFAIIITILVYSFTSLVPFSYSFSAIFLLLVMGFGYRYVIGHNHKETKSKEKLYKRKSTPPK